MDEERGDEFEVQVVYALPNQQIAIALTVEPGTTVAQAVERSGLIARFPEIAGSAPDFGIYGKRVEPSAHVHAFDRIEIYRPLTADPKQARRLRARKKRAA